MVPSTTETIINNNFGFLYSILIKKYDFEKIHNKFFLQKLIETECFEEINKFGPNNTPSPDLRVLSEAELIELHKNSKEKIGCFGFSKDKETSKLTRPFFGRVANQESQNEESALIKKSPSLNGSTETGFLNNLLKWFGLRKTSNPNLKINNNDVKITADLLVPASPQPHSTEINNFN